jgi:sporulation protein YlmC with PRC-barrel domain
MRLSDLYDAHVCTTGGERLGRIHEVIVEAGQVKEIGFGAVNLLERLAARRHGRHIAWEKVKKIEDGKVIIEG